MATCWAEKLGDCADGMSGEHYVSHGIFDSESIVVCGLPWCRNEPASIGIGSAVAKILCGRHNSRLSRFDDEASRFSKFLTRNIRDDPLAQSEVTLNGIYLEKWALKTFLNLGYLRALHRGQEHAVVPRQDLVDYLYRDSPVGPGIGLYFVTGTVSNTDFSPGLTWNVIRNKTALDRGLNEVLGIVFIFCGIRIAISIVPVRAEEKISAMGKVNDFDYSEARVLYRPDNMFLGSETAGRKMIRLTW